MLVFEQLAREQTPELAGSGFDLVLADKLPRPCSGEEARDEGFQLHRREVGKLGVVPH